MGNSPMQYLNFTLHWKCFVMIMWPMLIFVLNNFFKFKNVYILFVHLKLCILFIFVWLLSGQPIIIISFATYISFSFLSSLVQLLVSVPQEACLSPMGRGNVKLMRFLLSSESFVCVVKYNHSWYVSCIISVQRWLSAMECDANHKTHWSHFQWIMIPTYPRYTPAEFVFPFPSSTCHQFSLYLQTS